MNSGRITTALALSALLFGGCASLSYTPKTSVRAAITFKNSAQHGNAWVYVYDNPQCYLGKPIAFERLATGKTLPAEVDAEQPLIFSFLFARHPDAGRKTCAVFAKFSPGAGRRYDIELKDSGAEECEIVAAQQKGEMSTPMFVQRLVLGKNSSGMQVCLP